MEDKIFCPGCGDVIVLPAKACPTCQAPLPSPKTVIGFPEPPPVVAKPVAPVEQLPDLPPQVMTLPGPGPQPARPGATNPGYPGPAPQQSPLAQEPPVGPAQQSPLAHEPAEQPAPHRGRRGTLPIPEPGPQPAAQPVPAAQPLPPPPPAWQVQAPAAFEPLAAPGGATAPKEPAPEALQAGVQPFIYGQPAPRDAPLAAQPTPESEQAPTDTRKGLVWRTVAGGAWLTWALLFGAFAGWFVVAHFALLFEHGASHLHEVTWSTFGLAAGALVPAMLLLLTSVSCLWGRGWPRAFGVLAALAHAAWAITTTALLVQTFDWHRTVPWGVVASVLTAVITVFLVALLLAGGKWVGQSPAGKPARAVPYPLWGGPLLIVLASVTFAREVVSVVALLVQNAKRTYFASAVREVYDSYPFLVAGVAGLITSALLIVAGIALLRRARWSVGLGGAMGLLTLAVQAVVITLLFVSHETYFRDGPSFGLIDVYVALAWSLASWVALVAALRFGFRLPKYLRDAPATGPDGKRIKLLDILAPPQASS
jgi:hypothetical protein